jgi:CBS domain-containing protein
MRASGGVMEIAGLGKRVQIFVDEADSLRGRSLYLAILETLRGEGAAGATVTRGIAGFGSHSRIHTARLADLASPLPIVITWVDAPDRIERLLPTICGMVREGLVTVEDVQVAKYTHRDLPALRSSLTVGDLMTREVASVQQDTPLGSIVEALIDRDFRAVPVVNLDGQVAGIITNTDLVERGELPARLELLAAMDSGDREAAIASAGARTAQDVMTRLPIVIRPTAPVEQAVQLMLTEGLKRLPVIDEQGHLVGMLSRADVLRSLGEGFPLPENGGQGAGLVPTIVSDVMTRHVPAVRADARLAEVLDAVVSTRLNRAVVIDEQGRVKGVISDADLLKRLDPRLRSGVLGALMRRGRLVPEQAAHTTAAELMTAPALTVAPDTPIDQAARRMVDARRKVLPIVDTDGTLLGIVDRAHLLGAVSDLAEGAE